MKRPCPTRYSAQKYDTSSLELERVATHLIALLYADRELKYSYAKYGLDNLLSASEFIESFDVVQMTVQLAAGYRLIHWNAKTHAQTVAVGDLWPKASSETPVDLTVVEACNKIIHATKLAFSTKKVRGAGAYYLEPLLLVQGTKGKDAWTAQIDMLLFCNEVLAPHNSLQVMKPTSGVSGDA